MITGAEHLAEDIEALAGEFIEMVRRQRLHPLSGVTAMLTAIERIAQASPTPLDLASVKELVALAHKQLDLIQHPSTSSTTGPTN